MSKELTMEIPIVLDKETIGFLSSKVLKGTGVDLLCALADNGVFPESPAHLKIEFVTPSFTRGQNFRSEPAARIIEDFKDKLRSEKEHLPTIIADMILSIPAEDQVKVVEYLRPMPDLYAAVAVVVATKLGEVE